MLRVAMFRPLIDSTSLVTFSTAFSVCLPERLRMLAAICPSGFSAVASCPILLGTFTRDSLSIAADTAPIFAVASFSPSAASFTLAMPSAVL